MNTKIETWLPVFPGFYNTLFEPESDLSESVAQGKRDGILPADYEWWKGDNFDNSAYKLAVVKECCEAVWEMLPKEIGISELEFEEIRSPKEYNFTNDAVNIAAHVHLEKFTCFTRKYLKEHSGEWAAYLLRYKSRDGFISFYPHTPKEWQTMTQNYSCFEIPKKSAYSSRMIGPHSFGALLNFYLHNENEDAELSLYYKVSESVGASSYLKEPTKP